MCGKLDSLPDYVPRRVPTEVNGAQARRLLAAPLGIRVELAGERDLGSQDRKNAIMGLLLRWRLANQLTDLFKLDRG